MSETRPAYRLQPADHALQAVEFWLPLPPAGCSPNGSHGHWSKHSAAIREYRAECLWLLPKVAGAPAFCRAEITVTFYLAPLPGRYHPRDVANAIASFKAAGDAIVDANWLPDDGVRYLTWGRVELLRTAAGHGGRSGCAVGLRRVAGA